LAIVGANVSKEQKDGVKEELYETRLW
jgi:hypothetical protein